jgi:hypothetical protein
MVDDFDNADILSLVIALSLVMVFGVIFNGGLTMAVLVAIPTYIILRVILNGHY